MNIFHASALLALALVSVGNVHAQNLTYRLEGVFSSSGDDRLPVGAAYSATLTFDPTILVASADPIGGIQYSFGSFSFRADSINLDGSAISDPRRLRYSKRQPFDVALR